jgi:hypothetical protein
VLVGGFFVVVVSGHWLKVFGFKYLVAIQAAYIIYAVAPRHYLGTSVIAGLHKRRLSPF